MNALVEWFQKIVLYLSGIALAVIALVTAARGLRHLGVFEIAFSRDAVIFAV